MEDFKKVLLGDPHAILGKNGVTHEFADHVIKLIKRFKIVKVKALRSVATKSNIKEIAQQVAENTGSYLLDVRGKTFILSKKQIDTKK